MARPHALRYAAQWLRAHGRPYADELLNRSRRDPHFATYFTDLAASTVVERVSKKALVGIPRRHLTLAALLDDAARGVGAGEGGCNVYAATGSHTRCSGECATRLRSLAYVHQSEGLLDCAHA